MYIDVSCLDLIIQDPLAGIQSAVSGQNITEGTCDGKIDQGLRSKQLNRKKNGSNRTVDCTAKHTDQADSRSKSRGDP